MMRATPAAQIDALVRLVKCSRRLVVLTGAGCSTESGIPDYRDDDGNWKHRRPVQYRDFVASLHTRKRYWARSLAGWEQISRAEPNRAHRALARLERAGSVLHLITQNVDGLHQSAGSRKVIDLHGRLDTVTCLGCGAHFERSRFQTEMEALNPDWSTLAASHAPDGDADLEGVDFAGFAVPDCRDCSGILKPDVVFFGESVPRQRVALAMEKIKESDALLVVGSSLMVWSGYRFARAAAMRGIPLAAINLGRTRVDDMLHLKVVDRCGSVLPFIAGQLGL